MGKVNVYLPDELERAVREAGIPVSAVCQTALRAAVQSVEALRRSGTAGSVPMTARLEEVLATGPTSALDLLGAVVLHGENLGARVLRDLGVELPAPTRPARKRGGRGAPSPEVREALVGAYRVALELGHGYLGTEHVVVALAREGSPAAPLFAALGLDERAVQQRVVRLLANPWRVDDAGAPAEGPAPERLERFERELQRLTAELHALRRSGGSGAGS